MRARDDRRGRRLRRPPGAARGSRARLVRSRGGNQRTRRARRPARGSGAAARARGRGLARPVARRRRAAPPRRRRRGGASGGARLPRRKHRRSRAGGAVAMKIYVIAVAAYFLAFLAFNAWLLAMAYVEIRRYDLRLRERSLRDAMRSPLAP